jgi:hypothetical protein
MVADKEDALELARVQLGCKQAAELPVYDVSLRFDPLVRTRHSAAVEVEDVLEVKWPESKSGKWTEEKPVDVQLRVELVVVGVELQSDNQDILEQDLLVAVVLEAEASMKHQQDPSGKASGWAAVASRTLSGRNCRVQSPAFVDSALAVASIGGRLRFVGNFVLELVGSRLVAALGR